MTLIRAIVNFISSLIIGLAIVLCFVVSVGVGTFYFFDKHLSIGCGPTVWTWDVEGGAASAPQDPALVSVSCPNLVIPKGNIVRKRITGVPWESAGRVDIHSGFVMIGDPTLQIQEPSFEDNGDVMETAQHEITGLDYDSGHPGKAILIGRPGVEGTYPVFIRRDRKGQITEINIVIKNDESE